MENEEWVFEEGEKPYNIRHRCFHFAKDVLKFERECKYEHVHFSIFDQLIRSATSIGANVVEGSAGSTRKDFINFFHIALKSANETKYWMCLIRDAIEVDKNSLEQLIREADEISKILASILLSTK